MSILNRCFFFISFFAILIIGDSTLDTFVVKDRFGLDVICKVLGSFEIEGFPNKYIAYTDYIYDKDLKYNVYFSEVISNNDKIELEEIKDQELYNQVKDMYESVGGNNDL